MDEQDRREKDGEGSQSDRPDSVETDSVPWRDTFVAGADTPERTDTADESHEPGETDAQGELRGKTRALQAIQRASELFVGLSGGVDDSLRTYVTELPQWFRHPESTEVEIRVGDDVFETDGFQRTGDPLTAEARTQTGTAVSTTVVCTDQRPDTGEREWLPAERELVEAVVSLLKEGIDRWEIDSLKRLSDGVVVLDGDLNYTYVNQQAEDFLRSEAHV